MNDQKRASSRPRVDGRSSAARRFRKLCQIFTDDLNGEISAAEGALIRQAAAMTMQAEDLQAALLRGDTVDTDAMVRLSNASARLLSALGVQRRKRRPKHVAPWRRKDINGKET